MFADLESLAVVTALLYVFFAIREQAICFLFGFISATLYILICFEAAYYFDMGIQAYYSIVSIYGLFLWRKKKVKKEVVVNQLNSKKLKNYIVAGLALTVLLGWVGKNFLVSSLPFMDAFTTAFSIIATWMIVQKNIENWIFWIVIDAVGVYMYYYKDLEQTAFLYAVYVVLSVVGYFKWRKELQNTKVQ